MFKLVLALFAAFMLTATAVEKDRFLRELKEKYEIETLSPRQEEEEVQNFKNLDRVQQLLEIKRKLMQTLGGVNDAYRELGISSLEVKTEILSILRKVQNIPQDVQLAKSVFQNVYQSLDELIQFIPKDANAKVQSQKPGRPSQQWPSPDWEQGEGQGQGSWQGQGQGQGHGQGQGPWQGQGQGSWQGQGGGQGAGQGGGQGGGQGSGQGQWGSWQGQGQEQDNKPGKNPWEGSIVVPEPEVEHGLLSYLLYPICGALKLCKKLVFCLFSI